MTTDSNLKLENLSVEHLKMLRSCFLDIADILEKVASDFDNIILPDIVTDEEMDTRKLTNEVISKARR